MSDFQSQSNEQKKKKVSKDNSHQTHTQTLHKKRQKLEKLNGAGVGFEVWLLKPKDYGLEQNKDKSDPVKCHPVNSYYGVVVFLCTYNCI